MKGVISRVVERVLVMFTSALVRGRASNGTCDLLVFGPTLAIERV